MEKKIKIIAIILIILGVIFPSLSIFIKPGVLPQIAIDTFLLAGTILGLIGFVLALIYVIYLKKGTKKNSKKKKKTKKS